MPLTVSATCQTLAIRLGGRLELVGLANTAVVSSTNPALPPTPPDLGAPNPVLLDAINWAAEVLGVNVATYGAPVDSDLASIQSPQYRAFEDLAELRTLTTILGNAGQIAVSSAVQDSSDSFSDPLKDIQTRVASLEKLYEIYLRPYAIGASSGSIRHIPPTAFPPAWRPGFGGPRGRGYGGWGGYGGGWGGW